MLPGAADLLLQNDWRHCKFVLQQLSHLIHDNKVCFSIQPLAPLLQATFKNDAEEYQHIAGPAHRKALQRQQSEQEQQERLARGRNAANSAVVRRHAMCACNALFAYLKHSEKQTMNLAGSGAMVCTSRSQLTASTSVYQAS